MSALLLAKHVKTVIPKLTDGTWSTSVKMAANTLQELREPCGFFMDVKMVNTENSKQITGLSLVTLAMDEVAATAIAGLRGATLHRLSIVGEVVRGDAPAEGLLTGGQW